MNGIDARIEMFSELKVGKKEMKKAKESQNATCDFYAPLLSFFFKCQKSPKIKIPLPSRWIGFESHLRQLKWQLSVYRNIPANYMQNMASQYVPTVRNVILFYFIFY